MKKGDLRKCITCGEEKPATTEYFYREKSRSKICSVSRVKGGLKTECKDCASKRMKRWREENPEKAAAAVNKWRKENPEKCRASDNKWRKQRRKEDPVYRLISNMRSGLWKCLSGKQKNSRTFDYIGLTPKELMDYLEGQFTEGMTRENHGEWHVDHIRPLSSFDFTGPDREEQLHAAWSHTNMQPLWASDNIRKGDRYEEGSIL